MNFLLNLLPSASLWLIFTSQYVVKSNAVFSHSWLTWLFKRRLPAELGMKKVLIECSKIDQTF